VIFNLFKTKPTLKELIPEGFVDIHSHILPGIDDGAKNIKESVMLAIEMKKLGFSSLITTPHSYPGLYDNNNISIKASYEKVKNPINKLNIKFNYASEYLIHNSIINKAEKGELLTIKNNYLLVEMSFLSAPMNLYEILYKIQMNGYIPILAHPERYSFLFNRFSEYKNLKNRGCLFQLNLLSSTGYYGEKISKISEKLLKENLIDFVGSDIHNINQIRAMHSKLIISSSKKLIEAVNKTQEIFSRLD
tara:strand:- start:35137 stop:35880 length:744 start_codon:yes stop_codon:yes gene_type:complete